VAVKVTEVPAQIAPEGEAAILTLTGSAVVTFIVIGLEVAGLPDTQVKEDVITTVTILPLARVVVVYVEPVSPGISIPPFFHW
jgi:hypothetical protein